VGKLRHFAMSAPDPWKTAESYKYAFGMEVVGETDSSLAERAARTCPSPQPFPCERGARAAGG
jgi:hypothetical protein